MGTTTSARTGPASLGGDVGLATLAVGPVITVIAITSGAVAETMTPMALIVALVFWSPLPFSIPALILQDARDAALDEASGVLGWARRTVMLIPWLATATASGARLAAILSIAGFAAGVATAIPHL